MVVVVVLHIHGVPKNGALLCATLHVIRHRCKSSTLAYRFAKLLRNMVLKKTKKLQINIAYT